MKMGYLDSAKDFYYDTLSRGDKRVEDWLLMATPIPVTMFFVAYIAIVVAGPHIMAGRNPFNIRYLLFPYNVALVILSVYMFKEFLITSLRSNYSYLCQPVDYSESPLAMRMANVCWWFFFSKVIELLDTVFFIMRKKFDQVTFLHVYHHSSMIFNWWFGVKYVAGGQSFFTGMLNSFVHIFMYSYYALSLLGPNVQKYLWWKRYLTRLQLIQFFAFVVHTGYNLITDCDFPQTFNIAVFLYAISLIILFGNFYYRAYTLRQRDNRAAKKTS